MARSAAEGKADTSNEMRLITAAINCIEKYGIAKTFIDDISREAGLSRPTAYRTFSSREALLEQVAAHVANNFKNRVKKNLKKYASFEDAITLGAIASLYLGKNDKVFIAILDALGDQGLERYLLNPKGPVFKDTLEAWRETFQNARTKGKLRDDVTDEELVTLIISANSIFMLRDDMNRKEQTAFLRKFLLPAIMPKI